MNGETFQELLLADEQESERLAARQRQDWEVAQAEDKIEAIAMSLYEMIAEDETDEAEAAAAEVIADFSNLMRMPGLTPDDLSRKERRQFFRHFALEAIESSRLRNVFAWRNGSTILPRLFKVGGARVGGVPRLVHARVTLVGPHPYGDNYIDGLLHKGQTASGVLIDFHADILGGSLRSYSNKIRDVLGVFEDPAGNVVWAAQGRRLTRDGIEPEVVRDKLRPSDWRSWEGLPIDIGQREEVLDLARQPNINEVLRSAVEANVARDLANYRQSIQSARDTLAMIRNPDLRLKLQRN